jgi:hypothetical protein
MCLLAVGKGPVGSLFGMSWLLGYGVADAAGVDRSTL